MIETNRCEIGDCRDVMRRWIAEGVRVQMCVTSPRQANGRFMKGVHAYRKPRPHWQKEWLEYRYVTLGRSALDIATEISCTENNVLFWLAKHDIPRRSMSDVRALKYWGQLGSTNPMFGKIGPSNPNYIDGSSPLRQRLYARVEGREFIKAVYRRDGYRCRRCGAGKTAPRSLHAHHIKPWAGNQALRFDEGNAVTLCRKCHSWVHSKKNTSREFLGP